MFPWFSVWLPETLLCRCRRPFWSWVFACVLSFPASAALQAVIVAPGVYVIPAPLAEASPDNRGQVVNTGFLVGKDGVIVIDSGANHLQGEAILSTVRRTTPKPVKLVINTHPHPQNVLGNSAFARHGIPILASAATQAAMNERCPRCLKSLTESIGAAAMRGTRIRLPDRTVAAETRLVIAGRALRLLHFGHGHTEGDLLVQDEATATLFAGDLVYRDQVPHLTEADTRGWLAVLERLAAQPFDTLVPGRGPVGNTETLATMHRYLSGLRQRVREAYEKGLSADETITYADLPAFSGWQGYATRHGLNVQHVYFEIEREDLGQDTKP